MDDLRTGLGFKSVATRLHQLHFTGVVENKQIAATANDGSGRKFGLPQVIARFQIDAAKACSAAFRGLSMKSVDRVLVHDSVRVESRKRIVSAPKLLKTLLLHLQHSCVELKPPGYKYIVAGKNRTGGKQVLVILPTRRIRP